MYPVSPKTALMSSVIVTINRAWNVLPVKPSYAKHVLL